MCRGNVFILYVVYNFIVRLYLPFIWGSRTIITDSTELFVFSATLENRPPLPLTHPNSPGSSGVSETILSDVTELCIDSLLFSVASFSPPLTNSNSEDSLEAVGCPTEVILDGFEAVQCNVDTSSLSRFRSYSVKLRLRQVNNKRQLLLHSCWGGLRIYGAQL